MIRGILSFGVAAIVAMPGCQSERACVPGEVRECPCGGGRPAGTQVCSDDGTRYGACDCDEADADADADAVADVDSGADADMDADADSSVETETDADVDSVTDAPIDVPDGCAEYVFDRVSFVTAMQAHGFEAEARCCFDFDDDGAIDNALASLLDLLVTFGEFGGGEVNARLAERIATGEMCSLLEYHGMTSVTDDGGFFVPWFDCRDTDGNPTDNASGTEPFEVLESSFEAGPSGCTGMPASLFPDASVGTGTLRASGSIARMTLPFLADDMDFSFPLGDARLEATLSESADGVSAIAGRLGGAVPLASVFDYQNDYAAEFCDCLGLAAGTDLVTWAVADEWTVECADVSGSTCTEPDDPVFCTQLPTLCGFFGLFPSVADVDSDADGIADALSAGFAFESVSAAVSGIASGI